MILTIGNRKIESSTVRTITITPENVLVDSTEDFYRIRYQNPEEIEDAKNWIKFQHLQIHELNEAMSAIILTCTHFINSKNQCRNCPIKRSYGCFFEKLPYEWEYNKWT